jgi:hypothetical protein
MIGRSSSNRVIHACLTLCTLALIACPPAHAQSDDTPDQAPDIEDRWALQFRVYNLFDLNIDGFQGSLISAKKQYSAGRAFRFGLDFGASISRQDTELETSSISRDLNRSQQTTNAIAQWIRYPVHDGTLRAYWGAGPTVGFSRLTSSSETSEASSGSEDSDRWSLRGGAVGVVGAEWFVRSRISLTAEYQSGFTYQYTRRTDESSTGTEHQFRLGSRAVLVGLSLYF